MLIHGERGVGERIATELSQQGHIHHLKGHILFGTNGACQLYFGCVLLSIGESKGKHFVKLTKCPKETGGGVLSATQNDQSFIVHCG